MTQEERDIKRKRRVEEKGNISKACRFLGLAGNHNMTGRKYEAKGDEGLINSRPCPENPTLRI